jgi:hypothetical protein
MTDDKALLGWDAGDDDQPIPPRPDRTGLIAHAATNLSAPPAYHANNRVRARGQRLSRTIWKGWQWAVTARGIECRDGTYFIDKCRLWQGEANYGWVRHMSEKNWVDQSDFAEALRIARRVHAKHSPRPSPDQARRTGRQ